MTWEQNPKWQQNIFSPINPIKKHLKIIHANNEEKKYSSTIQCKVKKKKRAHLKNSIIQSPEKLWPVTSRFHAPSKRALVLSKQEQREFLETEWKKFSSLFLIFLNRRYSQHTVEYSMTARKSPKDRRTLRRDRYYARQISSCLRASEL